MKLIIVSIFLLFLVQLSFATRDAGDDNDGYGIDNDKAPIVNTKNGRISGYSRKLAYKNRKLFIYEGIPYGKPPIGDLRFKPSEPVHNWDGVYVAQGYRNASMHSLKIKQDNEIPETRHQSEDCLFLSVYRPATNSKEKLPVMFWIHGGGFESGTIFSLAYDPSYAAGVGNVIVVAINYRLGPLGFLYADDDDAPGDLGLYDQILALKWTRDNIEFFGGDPEQITLFGESAGSMRIANHLLSPSAKGLFKRAIMQSEAANS